MIDIVLFKVKILTKLGASTNEEWKTSQDYGKENLCVYSKQATIYTPMEFFIQKKIDNWHVYEALLTLFMTKRMDIAMNLNLCSSGLLLT